MPDPSVYGFSPYGSRSISIETDDGETIRGWHILPRSRYLHAADLGVGTNDFSMRQSERVVIYFHGNAANRGMYHRVHICQRMSREMDDTHVISVDYRGFGDSSKLSVCKVVNLEKVEVRRRMAS